jgi:hypothetical protein
MDSGCSRIPVAALCLVGVSVLGACRPAHDPAPRGSASDCPRPRGNIDVALVWGPVAGYFAQASTVRLRVEPITPASDPRWPMAFDISMAVRRGDVGLRDRINLVLDREKGAVHAILRSYGVPLDVYDEK